MQEVKKDNIMVYSGTYVKRQVFGERKDYLTYDGDLKGNYKVYLDLATEEIYIVDINECTQFENINKVIYIPVESNSIFMYVLNFMNFKKWYQEQKENLTNSQIIETYKEKIKSKKINILHKKTF